MPPLPPPPVLPHLLLVDDSALVVEALRVLFEETGHRVTTAGCVADAAAAARRDRPDLVLLDVSLGQEDGIALLDVLRAAGEALPAVVAMTGHDDDQTRARCLAAGCVTVLVKPVPTRELLRVVDGLVPS